MSPYNTNMSPYNTNMSPYNTNMSPYNTNEIHCSVQDERYANLALSEADKSTMKYHKHGCIAVVGGTIVARGYNTYRSHSNDGFLNGSCSCHAEIDVLRKLSKIIPKKQQVLFSRRGIRSCFLGASKYVRRKKR